MALPKRYSEDLAWLMDQEIQRLILESEKKADEVLSANRKALDALAAELLKEEMIDREDIERIIKEAKGTA